MVASKIQNEAEVLGWFDEGRSYVWMVEEYERKYNISTTVNLWASFRRRHGLERRQVRNDDLIPWLVKPEHRWLYPVAMLRLEARSREGVPMTQANQMRLDGWKANLANDDLVVYYDPESDEGFSYVPRRKGKDLDLIHEPEQKTSAWVNSDKAKSE